MRFLFYLALVALCSGRLLSLPVLQSDVKSAPLSPLDLILAVLFGAYILRCLAQRSVPFLHAPNSRMVLGFVLWSCVSLLANTAYYNLSAGELIFSSLYLARWFEYSLFYFIGFDLISNYRDASQIVTWSFVGCGAFAVFGIFQAAFLPDFALTYFPDARPYIDYDPQGHRLVSSTLDPNIAAGYLLVFALVAASFYLHGFKRWLLPAVLFLVALLLTLSRGGATGLLVGLIYLLMFRKFPYRRAILATGALVAILLTLYPFLQPQIESAQRFRFDNVSTLGRLAEWRFALDVIADNWGVGIGFNTFGFLAPRFGFFREGAGAFNLSGDLLMVLMMTGVIGFCIYVAMYWHFLQAARALAQRSTNAWDKALGIGIQAATVGVMAASFFNSLILYPQIMGVLWAYWSLPLGLLRNVSVAVPGHARSYPSRSGLSPSMVRQEGSISSRQRVRREVISHVESSGRRL